ncbi:glycosyltransferase [Microvirga sp. W0021]|uniref:Glycosyltransferase n=1 Tax=Hohaiivirga grylli TaxID=3133970 RepID=A0ABV0BIA8_9HYPH
MNKLSITILVTHLLGAGHLTRAAALAEACAQKGHNVTLISGGMPNKLLKHTAYKFMQLPSVRIEGTAFTKLLMSDGQPATEAFLAQRTALIETSIRQDEPDVLITELFPFGRRVLAHEFISAITTLKAQDRQAVILSSIRDILASPSKPERIEETEERISSLYDGVLIHGDDTLIPLEESWPVSKRLHPFLHYTGYIDNIAEDNESEAETYDVTVSGGSSAAGLKLYHAALECAGDTPYSWHLLIGNAVPEDTFNALTHKAAGNVTIERARSDFRSLLSKTRLSISQCGYNTAIDVLSFPIERLFVPFEAGSETEQLLRATTLQNRGYADLLRETELSPETLKQQVHEILSRVTSPIRPSINLDGTRQSVLVIENLVKGRY